MNELLVQYCIKSGTSWRILIVVLPTLETFPCLVEHDDNRFHAGAFLNCENVEYNYTSAIFKHLLSISRRTFHEKIYNLHLL